MWAGSYWAKSYWSGRYWGPIVEEAVRQQGSGGGGGSGRAGERRGDRRFSEVESPEWFAQLDRWEAAREAGSETAPPPGVPGVLRADMSAEVVVTAPQLRAMAEAEKDVVRRNNLLALLLILEEA